MILTLIVFVWTPFAILFDTDIVLCNMGWIDRLEKKCDLKNIWD
jgi:hypothetical protein